MKIKKLIALLLLLLLVSCPAELPIWERTYQMKNNSGYELVIRLYENFSNVNFEDIIVLNDQFYRGDIIEGRNFDALDDVESIRPGQSYSSFKIIVFYDNERKMEYSLVDTDEDGITDSFSDPLNRNLLRAGTYMSIGNDVYEFVLTEEDYYNATPCDGDCLD